LIEPYIKRIRQLLLPWGATDKFTVVLETAGLNATELSAYCRERGLYPEQAECWLKASQDANESQCSP
jgi:hypothetical protein